MLDDHPHASAAPTLKDVLRGLMEPAALERALRAEATSGEPLLRIVSLLGLAAEDVLADALAEALGLRRLGPDDYPAEPVCDGSRAGFYREARAVPVAREEGELTVAVADPFNTFTRRSLEMAFALPVRLAVGRPSEIEAAIARLYPEGNGRTAADGDAVEGALDEDVERLRDMASEAPVVRLVDGLIAHAVEIAASDIHIERLAARLRVRLRLDGVLREEASHPASLHAAVVSRIKIMAGLDIAERRVPQDGRVRMAVHGKPIDLRVSTVPGVHGESAVLRILDRAQVALDFAALGFDGALLETWLAALRRPNSIVLVTGPTGSGKTTTLYASLAHLNTVDTKILTVEDPVEYQLEGISQIQVHPQIDLTFARVLRSLLRQDPDVLMVGEIRDRETAEIAVQAALTGHLLLSTLHTNSAAATMVRLLDMGVDPYLVTATVGAVAAQRLVRRLCPKCRVAEEVPRSLARDYGLPVEPGAVRLWRPAGCADCGHTGYRGRTTVAELLLMTDRLRRLVLGRADVPEIEACAVADGMVPMFRHGLDKALRGETSLEEVLRVTREA